MKPEIEKKKKTDSIVEARYVTAEPVQLTELSAPIQKYENVIVGRLSNFSFLEENKGGVNVTFKCVEERVWFAGDADAESFFRTCDYFTKSLDLLAEAVNNRTRERNYFRKYAELLMGELSDEDFNREIEENEAMYVIQPHIDASLEDLNLAVYLAKKGGLMDIDSIDDIIDLFSFKYPSLREKLRALQE